MVTALIVDDEEKNREALAKMIDQFCHDVRVIGKADCVEAAKAIIEKDKPQLVLLDVEMPGGSGFDLLEQYEDPKFNVIFTTAHAAYAIKAIKFAALDYLLKPINLNELKAAVEKAIINIENRNSGASETSMKFEVLRNNRERENFDFKKIALPTIDGLDFYELAKILRCEADRSYCNFYFEDGTVLTVSKSMKEFEDLLEECNFFKVHKSNMINMDHLKKYVKGKGGYVILSDDSSVDVSVRRRDELLKALRTK